MQLRLDSQERQTLAALAEKFGKDFRSLEPRLSEIYLDKFQQAGKFEAKTYDALKFSTGLAITAGGAMVFAVGTVSPEFGASELSRQAFSASISGLSLSAAGLVVAGYLNSRSYTNTMGKSFDRLEKELKSETNQDGENLSSSLSSVLKEKWEDLKGYVVAMGKEREISSPAENIANHIESVLKKSIESGSPISNGFKPDMESIHKALASDKNLVEITAQNPKGETVSFSLNRETLDKLATGGSVNLKSQETPAAANSQQKSGEARQQASFER